MKRIRTFYNPLIHLYTLSFKELARNRFGMFLLVIIPAVFLLIVEWTSGTELMPIDLYFQDGRREVMLSQHDINIVFIGAAVSGFLTAYFAILLFYRNFKYFRHCIGMGLSPTEFVGARFLFFLTVTVLLAVFITVLIRFLTSVESMMYLFAGFLLVGTIYGTFGAIVGLVSREIMEAILGVVLLANLDAGWLQNPLFYSSSQQVEFIQWLPAYYPSQAIFASAFTPDVNSWAFLKGSLYAAILLVMMILLIHHKIRSVNRWWSQ